MYSILEVILETTEFLQAKNFKMSCPEQMLIEDIFVEVNN